MSIANAVPVGAEHLAEKLLQTDRQKLVETLARVKQSISKFSGHVGLLLERRGTSAEEIRHTEKHAGWETGIQSTLAELLTHLEKLPGIISSDNIAETIAAMRYSTRTLEQAQPLLDGSDRALLAMEKELRTLVQQVLRLREALERIFDDIRGAQPQGDGVAETPARAQARAETLQSLEGRQEQTTERLNRKEEDLGKSLDQNPADAPVPHEQLAITIREALERVRELVVLATQKNVTAHDQQEVQRSLQVPADMKPAAPSEIVPTKKNLAECISAMEGVIRAYYRDQWAAYLDAFAAAREELRMSDTPSPWRDQKFIALLHQHYAARAPEIPASEKIQFTARLWEMMPEDATERVDSVYTLAERLEDRLQKLERELKEILMQEISTTKVVHGPPRRRGKPAKTKPRTRPLQHWEKKLASNYFERQQTKDMLDKINAQKFWLFLNHPIATPMRWWAGLHRKSKKAKNGQANGQ